MEITQEQRKKLERLLKVEKGGIAGILEYLFEIEEKIDKDIPTIKGLLSKVKGDKGDSYELNDDDKEEITQTVKALINNEDLANKVLSKITIDYNAIAKKASEYIKVPDAEKIDYKKIKLEVLKEIVINNGIDGKDADEVVIADKVANTLESKLPQFGEQFRDGLELLQDDDRLDKKAIKGLDDYEEVARLARQPKSGGVVARNLYQLGDTNIQSPTNDQVLKYNSANGLWENSDNEENVYVISSNFTAAYESQYIFATQPVTIFLPQITTSSIKITISNQSAGEVTVTAFAGNLVHDDTSMIISFHNSTAQLKSSTLGWVVV